MYFCSDLFQNSQNSSEKEMIKSVLRALVLSYEIISTTLRVETTVQSTILEELIKRPRCIEFKWVGSSEEIKSNTYLSHRTK